MNNIKRMFHSNPEKSKYKGILSSRVFSGEYGYGFVFYPDSEKCHWPVESSLYELILDGWKFVDEQKTCQS